MIGPVLCGSAASCPAQTGMIVQSYTGQTIYQPVVHTTLMPFHQFLGLLTQAQRQGLWGVMVSDTIFADDWWAWVAVVAENNGVVDTNQPIFLTLMAYCVSKSYLTQTQANELIALTPG
jgi:hypothetical protein